jgi:hypothetical protein
MRTSADGRNDALTVLGARLDAGFVRFYDGTKPTDSDTALSGNTLIVSCVLSNPACQAPFGGLMVFNAISAGVVAASGAPTFARFFTFDGTTAVADMDVPGEIQLSKNTWVLGEPFAGPSVTWSLPVGP